MSIDLTEKFIKGLKMYGLTYDEIINSNWKYCGGNQGRHLRYFKLSCKGEEIPDSTDECICGHNIIENCYITNGEEILILGNCCIKKFIPKSSRTCETCGVSHKKRKVNKCDNCILKEQTIIKQVLNVWQERIKKRNTLIKLVIRFIYNKIKEKVDFPRIKNEIGIVSYYYFVKKYSKIIRWKKYIDYIINTDTISCYKKEKLLFYLNYVNEIKMK